MSPLFSLSFFVCAFIIFLATLTSSRISLPRHPLSSSSHVSTVSNDHCVPEQNDQDTNILVLKQFLTNNEWYSSQQSDPWPHPVPGAPADPVPPRFPPPPPPGHGKDEDNTDPIPRPPHRSHPPNPRPIPPVPPSPPPHHRDPIPPHHPPPPHDIRPPNDSEPSFPSPRPPHNPDADLPDIDHRPHYNRLLHAASRLQFVPPFVFLVLLGLHSILLWAGEAYQQRRRELLHVHPEAGGPLYQSRLRSGGRGGYQLRRPSDTYVGNLGIPPSAEPVDLTQRDVAEREVASYVEQARSTQSVVREPRTNVGDPEIEPLLPRSSATNMGMEGSSAAEISGPSMGAGEASLLGGAGTDDIDPILLLFSEPDTEWGPSVSPSPLERRPLIVQPDALRAVKNGGQVAAMLFTITLAMALMGTLAITALPQPAAHDDTVGSRMRTFTVILSQWTILGVGIMWALGEATFLALHDLSRARILATLTILIMVIVYGVSLEAENRARLNEIDRIHRPSPGPFTSPTHEFGTFVLDILADAMRM